MQCTPKFWGHHQRLQRCVKCLTDTKFHISFTILVVHFRLLVNALFTSWFTRVIKKHESHPPIYYIATFVLMFSISWIELKRHSWDFRRLTQEILLPVRYILEIESGVISPLMAFVIRLFKAYSIVISSTVANFVLHTRINQNCS